MSSRRQELLSQQQLSPEQQSRLQVVTNGSKDVLHDLDALLKKYESLGTKSQRTWDRVGFGMQDVTNLRLKLISQTTLLDAFNNASSHARLEKKLNILITEIRSGKREGSIISTQTFGSMVTNDRETWRTFRRELEDVGISPTVINEKRRFIVDWFQQAVAAGQLDEDCDESDHGSYGGGSSIDNEDTTSNTAIEHALQNTEAGPANLDAQTFTRKQDSDRESSYKPLEKKSPLTISNFFGKLRFQESRLFRAAKDE
ncbi:hypothetical protein MMC30_001232 [Trapelia coarctata]|nr:hypothetical protein [Trapelia coarctata]